MSKIVVLTVLRNDAWILRRFLEVTSIFAERILILDQGSTDGSRAICAEFPKVTLLDDPSFEYDEGSRHRRLIDAARQLVPMPRILLGLVPNEVLAANAMTTRGWQVMLEAQPGAVLFFEKPNLYLSTANCERRPLDFAGGFVDDGVSEYRGQRIHSPRLPMPAGAPQLVLGEIKFLHYSLVRPEAQRARRRMFAALENVLGTRPLYARRRAWWSGKALRTSGLVEPTPREWFAMWESRGIDMTTVEDRPPYWEDLVTLDLLLKYGSRRFWLDDVWGKDWNRFIVDLGRLARVDPPPFLPRFAIDTAQRVLEWAR